MSTPHWYRHLMDATTQTHHKATTEFDGTYYIGVDKKGRMTFPIQLRRLFKMQEDSQLVISVENGNAAIEGRLPTVAETAGVVPPLDTPRTQEEIDDIVNVEVVNRYKQQFHT